MPPSSPDEHAVKQQLERILGSAGFTRNKRMSRFLRLVVQRTLEGRDSELKESVIAVEVFGRKADYDPKLDSVVRTEAGRLRARLTEYYNGEGTSDSVLIELPKGGYVPVFRERDVAQAQGRKESPRKVGDAPKPNQVQRWLTVATVLALSVVAAVGAWWWHYRTNQPLTIAVLPLKNLSPDVADDYFSDGLTDEIINNLAVIDGLAVRSLTSSFAFKGKPVNVQDVARQLNVDYILEGSVLREGSRLRINTRLVRVRDDLPMWSNEFDQELTDIFAIQDDISRGIVNNLRLKFGRGRRRYEASVEAYDLYLRARALPIHLGIGQGYAQSVGLFEQAIAKDPSFAPAYAGLASAYATESAGGAVSAERLGITEWLPRMRAAAEKAIQLDPLLAEAYAALGMANARDGQLEQSERNFRRAIELDPNLSIAHDEFAMDLLLPLGRIGEALHEERIAETADPLSPVTENTLAYILISAGRFGEAADHCQKLPADFPEKSQCLGRARLGQGRVDEAIQLLNTAPGRGYLGYAYARAGRREEAEQLVAIVPNRFDQALIYAGLGNKDLTLEAMGHMTRLGPFRVGRMLTFPEFTLLRGDPRVKDLRKKAGLSD